MLFAAKMADAMDVRTARMRVVSIEHQESAAIRSALHRATPAFADHGIQIWRIQSVPALIVMEYVSGCVMMGVPARDHLRDCKNAASIWYGVGRLMAFDLLINNFDRLPLAWSNDGNLGNIMLSYASDSVVGIDQSVQTITHPDGVRNYLQRVKSVCAEVTGGAGSAFDAVKQAIYNNTSTELSVQDIASMK